jgi:sugar-specific transcriptional regulator TrmB
LFPLLREEELTAAEIIEASEVPLDVVAYFIFF